MLRLTFLLRRKADIEPEEFYRYWREEHGPLVASHAQRLGMLRYVQVHTLHDEPRNEAMAAARGGMESIYDGVAEVWFENREALVAAMGSEQGARAGAELVEDEARFIDLAHSPLWLCHEYPQVNPTPENIIASERSRLVKLYFPLRCKADQQESDAQRYWYSNHGPIIRRQAEGSGIQRYLQVHRVADSIEGELRAARGTVTEPYMGHAELWFDRAVLDINTPETRLAGRRAIEDESTFIDFARSCMWMAKEHEFVNRL